MKLATNPSKAFPVPTFDPARDLLGEIFPSADVCLYGDIYALMLMVEETIALSMNSFRYATP